jgi:hypothetical protein
MFSSATWVHIVYTVVHIFSKLVDFFYNINLWPEAMFDLAIHTYFQNIHSNIITMTLLMVGISVYVYSNTYGGGGYTSVSPR